ncbi:MAG: PHB depolymerase family esterase [Actinomycetota bacterium]
MSSHQTRIGRWLLALALFAATIGSLAFGGDAALAASKAHCTTTIEPGVHQLDVDGWDAVVPVPAEAIPWAPVPPLLYVPESASARNVPLVVVLHPSGSTGDGMITGFYEDSRLVADEHGFAMLLVSGVIGPVFGGFEWIVPGVPLFYRALPADPPTYAPPGARDDVEFIEAAIDAAAEEMCIDLARVYVTGFSGGARMASQLACDLSDRVAAVAPISGIRFPLASDANLGLPHSQDCDPVRAVPMVTIHGLLDTVNPWASGTPGTSWSYSGETAVERWVDHNSCRETPYVTAMTDNIDLLEYRACHGNGDVTVAMVKNGEHNVPGFWLPWAPNPNLEVDGFELAWDLLASYRLPGKYVASLNK